MLCHSSSDASPASPAIWIKEASLSIFHAATQTLTSGILMTLVDLYAGNAISALIRSELTTLDPARFIDA
jgi:hypothetical protein